MELTYVKEGSREYYERAAIEGETLERGSKFLGLGTTPFGGPFRLRYEHPILAVLLLPHRFLLLLLLYLVEVRVFLPPLILRTD